MQSPSERAVVSFGGWRIAFNDARVKEALLRAIGAVLDAKPIPPGWTTLAGSENADVWKFQVGGRWFVLKWYRSRGIFDGIKALFRKSRAERAWASGEVLAREGIPTPLLLAVGKKFSLPLSYQNFLITEFVPDSRGLYTFIKTALAVPLDRETISLKRAMIRRLGRFIGRLHARGIMHGDLRLDNILVTDGEGGEQTFFLIDNERNKHYAQAMPDRSRLKNLVQVNMVNVPQITRTDRLRFFKAYLNENPELVSVEKEWVRNVFLKTRQRLQKKMPGVWEREDNDTGAASDKRV